MKKKKNIIKKIDCLLRQARVPVYLHHFGPKIYTSLQHCRAWLLKENLRCSWQQFIDDYAMLFLKKTPDRSTLIKFVQRLPAWLKSLLVKLSAGLQHAEFGAIDSTGLSRSCASNYYLKRIDQEEPVKRALKLSMYTSKHRILSFRLRAKWCGDTRDVPYLRRHAAVLPFTTCMDKGYDADWVHKEFRESGLCSIIPARKGCKRGKYRKEMRDYFDYSQYWERNCAEYNNSSLKRRFGSFLRSAKFPAQHAEVTARVILHNLRAMLSRLFHRSRIQSSNMAS